MYLKKQRVNFLGLCRETNTKNKSHLYTTSKMNKKTCKKRIRGAFSVSFEYFLLCLLKKRLSNLNRIQYGYSVVFFDCQSRDYVTLDVIMIPRIWQIFLDEDKWINGSMAEFCLKYFWNYFFFFWNFGSFCCPFFGIMLKEILLEYVLTEKYSLVWHN